MRVSVPLRLLCQLLAAEAERRRLRGRWHASVAALSGRLGVPEDQVRALIGLGIELDLLAMPAPDTVELTAAGLDLADRWAGQPLEGPAKRRKRAS